MALQRTKLADIQYVPATAGELIENTNGTDKIYVAGLTLFNGNTTTETVKIYFVPDNGSGGNGTADASNQFMELALVAKDTLFVEFPFPIPLTEDGDSLQASTTTASKVTVIVHGDKIT